MNALEENTLCWGSKCYNWVYAGLLNKVVITKKKYVYVIGNSRYWMNVLKAYPLVVWSSRSITESQ